MKKTIITIGILMTMSFTTSTITNVVYNQNLDEAMIDLEDYIDWMCEDMEYGNIDPVIGELYIYNFYETLDHLRDLSKEIKRRK